MTESPLSIQPSGYVLLVTPGMPTQKIADRMAKDGILSNPSLFTWWVFITNARAQLKAGEYFIKEGSTAQDVIQLLTSGKVMQHSLTIVEGWNFETLMQMLHESPYIKHTLVGLKPQEIMAKLGHADKHPEGHFFPDTYYFPLGTTDLAFLQRAYNIMQEKLMKAWEKRGSVLAVNNPYQILILASIIEKESCHFDEYKEISGVFHRRLLRGMPLQADPTVIYGAGKAYTGTITTELLKLQNPYNTYVNTGLPPTPIAMPSEKAILAALQPKNGDSLYFVSRGNCKGHIFSKTLEEHQAAVNHYRRILLSQQKIEKQKLKTQEKSGYQNQHTPFNAARNMAIQLQPSEALQLEHSPAFRLKLLPLPELQLNLIPLLRFQFFLELEQPKSLYAAENT